MCQCVCCASAHLLHDDAGAAAFADCTCVMSVVCALKCPLRIIRICVFSRTCTSHAAQSAQRAFSPFIPGRVMMMAQRHIVR